MKLKWNSPRTNHRRNRCEFRFCLCERKYADLFQTRKDPATLPGNVNKNKFIQALRDEYQCKKKDSVCPETYCFDSPDGDHIVLSHAHVDCWASAMVRARAFNASAHTEVPKLKDDDSATLLKPPNHKLFDASNKAVSPIIQRRQAALTAQNAAAAPPPAPIINFNGAFDFLRPLLPQPPVVPANATPNMEFSTTLLPTNRQAGPDMKLNTFCTTYDLSSKIIDKFIANDYMHARFFRFILIKELEDMGFTRGEIAALRDAVETWSILIS
jgi:hypothetical protein